jgi:hypothetical protein
MCIAIPRRRCAATLAFCVAVWVVIGFQYVCYAKDSSCQSSTVADLGDPQYAADAKSFLSNLQDVVRHGNATAFAGLVHYPVLVIGAQGKKKISRPAELVKSYASIVTPAVEKAILSQSSGCLFANYQGVMIGDGQIWFQQEPKGPMRIITINNAAPKSP